MHAVLAKQGLHLPVTNVFGPRGRAELAKAPLDTAYRARVNAFCRLIDALDVEVDLAAGWIAARLATDHGYHAIQAIPGVGPTWAAVFVAEIGDVTRFTSPRHLCSWAGLTPRHRESDTTVHRGSITKQGSTLIRWAAIEAAQKIPPTAGWLVATRAPDHRPPRPQHRHRRPRPQTTHPGLLRPTRRPYPRPHHEGRVSFGRTGRAAVMGSGPRQLAAWPNL